MTMADIYGKDFVFSPRVSPRACNWFPKDEAFLDISAGEALTVMGDMAVLCSNAVSTPEALRLLHDAGFSFPQTLHHYQGSADYLLQLRSLGGKGMKIALYHVHHRLDLVDQSCWIDPAVLSFLNNKANYAKFVDASHLARRAVFPSASSAKILSHIGLPIVFKAATGESTGAGADIFICKTPEDLSSAEGFFGNSPIVAEEFLKISRNLCLNFSVNNEGHITYIGSAEQISNDKGKHRGSWIDKQSEAPEEAVEIGLRIVRAGYEHGYYGCVGIDVAVTEDGRIIISGLNFRVTGPTAALMLSKNIERVLGKGVLHLRRFQGKTNYHEMLKSTYKALEEDILLPLCSYDPGAAGNSKGMPQLTALILGNNREEVAENERILADSGLV